MAGGNRFGLDACTAVTEAILQALAQASDEAALAGLMHEITRELGFRYYALIHHDDLRGSPSHRIKLLDYPEAVVERIIGQATWRRDPVIRASIFSQRAFRWSELASIIALDRRDRDCLEAGAKSGLDEGITVPFQLLGECAASCTFAGASAPACVRWQLGMAQMIGIFAVQAARRIMMASLPGPAPRPRLHPRPRECVLLAGRGYSNKEIARALSITPRTVDGYLTEARRLFGVHDRTELVVSALLAGEIGLHELRRHQPG